MYEVVQHFAPPNKHYPWEDAQVLSEHEHLSDAVAYVIANALVLVKKGYSQVVGVNAFYHADGSEYLLNIRKK